MVSGPRQVGQWAFADAVLTAALNSKISMMRSICDFFMPCPFPVVLCDSRWSASEAILVCRLMVFTHIPGQGFGVPQKSRFRSQGGFPFQGRLPRGEKRSLKPDATVTIMIDRRLKTTLSDLLW